MTVRLLLGIAPALVLGLVVSASSPAAEKGGPGYCVVVSKATQNDTPWGQVVATLVAKHKGGVVTFKKSVEESLAGLRKARPRYVCFVAKPAEATREFVAEVNRLTRRIDDDPYSDALWGILTGYDAGGAMRIAQQREPLVIRRVAAGTDVALEACEEGQWYCELNRGKMVRKKPGGKPETLRGPDDTTQALADALSVYRADLFVTSGHATERDWQIGFRYPNGQFRSKAGELFGLDTRGKRIPIHSDNPKVYLAVGNCLMGHIDGPDAMALAFFQSAGVCQMAGYTVPSWYGYAGWGLLDYFVEQPGRFNAAEAFFANQQALLHRLATCFPGKGLATAAEAPKLRGELPAAARDAGLTWQDAQGLLYDRDTLAFYGDPAWDARMKAADCAWEQSLAVSGGEYRFEIRPKRGGESFLPLNKNGSQRGGRPIFLFLPGRVRPESVRIVEGAELKPVVTDDFLLVPLPQPAAETKVYRIVFRATAETP
jgi:zinc protease